MSSDEYSRNFHELKKKGYTTGKQNTSTLYYYFLNFIKNYYFKNY